MIDLFRHKIQYLNINFSIVGFQFCTAIICKSEGTIKNVIYLISINELKELKRFRNRIEQFFNN